MHMDSNSLAATIEPTQAQSHSAADLELVDRLVDLWRENWKRDLEVRLQTGLLLNEHFGHPDSERQARGQEVLKMVAERLQTSQSEISRMRRFALYFKSLEELKDKNPDVDNWTHVKALLPTLKHGGKGTVSKAGSLPAILSGLTKSLQNLVSRVSQVQKDPGDEWRQDFVEMLQEFAEAVPDCLKVHLVVTTVKEDIAA